SVIFLLSLQLDASFSCKGPATEEPISVHSTTGASTAHLPGMHQSAGLRTVPSSSVHMGPADSAPDLYGRLVTDDQEPTPEERFSDFLTLQSERCLTTPQTSAFGSLSAYEWNPSNPDQGHKTPSHRTTTLNGLLAVHLVAGNGLSSSQILLRDLYCVIEMDSIRKARSMIRTSTSYFEWNEVFELDLEENRFLAFLLYQWDPRTKHRLCFYGGIDLRNLVTRLTTLQASISSPSNPHVLLSPALNILPTKFDKIALQLEPRGVLYLEFSYYPIEKLFHRYQSSVAASMSPPSVSDDVLFGVDIEELMERERIVTQLSNCRFPTNSTAVSGGTSRSGAKCVHIPLFIRKCIEEIDRRGTEVVGIYRLAGSVWMKLQVRELFNRVTRTTLRAIFHGDRKALEGITGSIDLSPEAVPIYPMQSTVAHLSLLALFKDFLRELPEPLFTSALYPMFYDAMQVTLPGFAQSGAKLMLNILDCLPTNNQEILLYLLDHFKRVTNNSDLNKMNTHNLATCLAPVLFYPAPNAARTLDPAILEPRHMTDILKFILEIWPDERSTFAQLTSLDSWTPSSPLTMEEQEHRLQQQQQQQQHHQLQQQRKYENQWIDYPFFGRGQSLKQTTYPLYHHPHYHRTPSAARSTLSGPAAPGTEELSPKLGHRSASLSTKLRQEYIGRSGRLKYNAAALVGTGPPCVQLSETYSGPEPIPRTPYDRLPGPSSFRPRPQRKANSQGDVLNLEQREPRRARHPRFHDIPTTSSTDSGTRSSLSAGGQRMASASSSRTQVPGAIKLRSTMRSFSQERPVYPHSPRPSHRSYPFT
ncbi:hypothetical protein FGIG_11860, partial [Fasciola gigantica]